METKWTSRGFCVTIGFSLLYFSVTVLAMTAGSFSPVAWMFMTALIGLLAGIPYLYISAREQTAGVALVMNLVAGLFYFAAGELSNLVALTLAASAAAAEIVRKISGYNSMKGNLFSYVFFVFGMSGSPMYIWIFRDYTVKKAAEEMSAEYAAAMDAAATPLTLALMIAATVVFALIGGLIGRTVWKNRLSDWGVK